VHDPESEAKKMAKAKGKERTPEVVEWLGRASTFCLGLAAMVVLAVVFALVMATMLATTVVPSGQRRS
jgi:hypothetical protein